MEEEERGRGKEEWIKISLSCGISAGLHVEIGIEY